MQYNGITAEYMQLYGVTADFMQLYEIIADIYGIISYNCRHFCNYLVYLPLSAVKWNEYMQLFMQLICNYLEQLQSICNCME